jgi:two-component system OmpR family response regulator/two-component system response regulator QseB
VVVPVFTRAKPFPAMLPSMRVLWVEDDPEVGEMVKETLEAEGYGADWVEDGEAALGLALVFPYDLLLLDVSLPRRDGFGVLAALREAGVQAPVLMLTARDSLEDRIRGLEGGADDYLVKPFHLAELRARVRALLRRAHGEASNEVTVGRLRLDLRGRRAWWEKEELRLSGREFAILEFLALHGGSYYPRERLLEHIWPGEASVDPRSLDPYISRLRAKLAEDAIETARGLGYRFRG